ncbi:NAD(P)-dependent dehydrogenase (short-subunit alcohol dehydrogenase family) [Agromyces flavus]|uniref:NAD(P)-dependent dehydrogenase (Short-subunit alcohol dehydrogenase family) n=1 Tax=Agromyces flavus TaxID=589382 RepID=A0A1H1Z2C6_9MICO|nr:SDR family oxidoreductase [Agromyces flavus]MCP2366893.1 NAD(P)-dependent dehydrogenase (short-subunit alcohol dehydrogenase family) [Agromyces flavus]GGI46810.1 short-chain dehydrogenase [Agromyces flavus]SDT27757.1 NAD(P)-dependent dehydrogenase, short-chain alcohol dehydrogenase family [Agromyces flavus]
MPRTYVVTGSASGIGRATADLLVERGHRVIGVDVHDADVVADLTTDDGRDALVAGVTAASDGRIDAIIANAGLATPTAKTVAVNYFGTIATLERLRPLLDGSPAPRAVATASMASLFPPDDALLDALLAGDERAAAARAAELEGGTPEQGNLIYGTTKRALVRWVRRNAASPQWAGAGIPLNAIAPGVVVTAMTQDLIGTQEARDALLGMVPMPLNGIFEARDAAYLLAWLTSEENAHLCGQVVFIDGGSDAVIRGDSTF